VSTSPPWNRRRALLWAFAVVSIIAAVWGIRRVELSLFALIDGWPETKNLLDRMWPPYIPSEDLGTIWRAVLDTFFMAFAGTAIGVGLAVPLALASARNVMPLAPVRVAARAIIVFTRAVPAIVFALVFVRVYGIGVLPGILAIGIHAVGMIGKLLSDAAENIDPGPRDGVLATGAGPVQDVVTGVWSQMVPTVISVSLYRLEIDFRGATLLGFVGAGGIGVILRGYQGNLRYQELLGTTLLIIVLAILMEVLSAVTRRALLGDARPDAGRRQGLLGLMLEARLRRAVRTQPTGDEPVPTYGRPDVAGTNGAVVTATQGASRAGLRPPLTPERFKLNSTWVGFVVLLYLSFTVPDVSISEFFSKVGDLPSTFWRLVPKDMTWLTDRVVGDLIETVAMGLASTTLALLAGIPAAFLAASNTAPGRWVYRSTRLFVLLVRAAPELVVAVIFVAAIGLGPATGTIALGIGMFGFFTKLFADAIEEISQGPRDGVFATGANRTQEIATGVVPQVLPNLLGNVLYVFDISLRSSTILGIVGAGGIGFLLNNAAKTLNFDVMGGIILSIFVIVYAIELLAGWVRRQVL